MGKTAEKRQVADTPKVHTTDKGSQYVKASEVIRSKAGKRALQALKRANLVEKTTSR